GMLGLTEVHPNEGEEDRAGFAGASQVAGADRLLEPLEESRENRAASREYLRARPRDLLLGGGHRRVGHWRWAGFDREGPRVWVPVPADRDNALSSYDGLLLGVARGSAPHLNEFTGVYPRVFGLVRNAQTLDRQILSDLPREAFESMATELQ